MSESVWIFGYGSLIWRPGFDFLGKAPARLEGYRRAFCRYSFRHRGTPEHPGLVIGLREGGACEGMAFRIAPGEEPAVLAYLDEREGEGYLRKRVPVRLLEGGREVWAWTYIPNPDHPSYFGEEESARLVELVATGRGESGTALDYLRNLVEQLIPLQASDPELVRVLHAAEAYGE